MNKLLTFLLLFISLTAFSQSTFNYNTDFKAILSKTKDSNDALHYNKLLTRFNSNDTTLTDYEVLALLIGFTDKPAYKPYQDISTERAIYMLNHEEKYNEGLELASEFLKTHPLSVKALFEKGYAFYKLGNQDSAEYYAYRGQRILMAMYFSGDGLTPETPAFALGPADGQDFIYKFVGAGIGTMGSGRDKSGNFLDILEAEFENGRTVNLYFIIQHATNKMFDGKSIEEAVESKKGKKKKN